MSDGLTLTYQALRRILGVYAGWGGDDGKWSSEQKLTAQDVFRDGMRRAYYPVDMRGKAVRWSFLTPSRELVTVADQSDYDMPDDFGGIIGPLSYSSADSGTYPVQLVSETTVRNRRQFSSDGTSGAPELVAVEQTSPGVALGTRYRLLLWPTPNDTYTLSYRCVVSPQPAGPDSLVPPGGPRMSGLLKAAILAEYESRFNDGQSQWLQIFNAELATAIAQDAAHDPEHVYPDVQSHRDSAWTTGQPAVRWRPGQVRFSLDD
jgi:hypothetical protein